MHDDLPPSYPDGKIRPKKGIPCGLGDIRCRINHSEDFALPPNFISWLLMVCIQPCMSRGWHARAQAALPRAIYCQQTTSMRH